MKFILCLLLILFSASVAEAQTQCKRPSHIRTEIREATKENKVEVYFLAYGEDGRVVKRIGKIYPRNIYALAALSRHYSEIYFFENGCLVDSYELDPRSAIQYFLHESIDLVFPSRIQITHYGTR